MAKKKQTKPTKQTKQAKQTDRAITIEDLAELLVAMDKKITSLEDELKNKDADLERVKQRMGL